MANLLIICQKVDDDDDLLGFFAGWIREFARHFDKVFVIALGKGRYELPSNVEVYSLGKERGSSKIYQFISFYKNLFNLVPKSGGIFTHMSPIFAIMASPAARLYKKKIILWYLHRSVTFRLRLAALLSYKIVTASAESLGIKIPSKIIPVGHGIDTGLFKPTTNRQTSSTNLRILSVGRISPIKNYETLIESICILAKHRTPRPIDCLIIGRPVMPGDQEYLRKLKRIVEEKCPENLIKFVGFVPFSKMPTYYQRADIMVNLTPRGGIDKTVLEAMASGMLVLVSNNVFRRTFGPYAGDLIFRENDPRDLAAKIKKLSELSLSEKSQISGHLRSEVEKNHELSKTIRLISELFNGGNFKRH